MKVVSWAAKRDFGLVSVMAAEKVDQLDTKKVLLLGPETDTVMVG